MKEKTLMKTKIEYLSVLDKCLTHTEYCCVKDYLDDYMETEYFGENGAVTKGLVDGIEPQDIYLSIVYLVTKELKTYDQIAQDLQGYDFVETINVLVEKLSYCKLLLVSARKILKRCSIDYGSIEQSMVSSEIKGE